jgi:hypothetical protein
MHLAGERIYTAGVRNFIADGCGSSPVDEFYRWTKCGISPAMSKHSSTESNHPRGRSNYRRRDKIYLRADEI